MVNKRWLLCASVALLVLALPISYVGSARDFHAEGSKGRPVELIVFEADRCIYCEVLRRDVVPIYTASSHSKAAPLRFFNVSHSDETTIGLTGPITLAPTVVFLRNGREAGRIAGYTGPDAFLQFASLMIGHAD